VRFRIFRDIPIVQQQSRIISAMENSLTRAAHVFCEKRLQYSFFVEPESTATTDEIGFQNKVDHVTQAHIGLMQHIVLKQYCPGKTNIERNDPVYLKAIKWAQFGSLGRRRCIG
jgi:hypothetical protein